MSLLAGCATALSAATAIGLAIVVAKRSPRRPDAVLEWTATAGFCVAFFSGGIAALGIPGWGGWEYQPFWVSLALVICCGVQAAGGPSWLVATLATAALGGLVFLPCAAAEWPATDARVSALLILIAATYALLEGNARTATRYGRFDGTIVCGLLTIGLCVVCLQSGYAKFTILGAVLGAVCLPMAFVVSVSKAKYIPHTAVVFFTSIWIALLAGAWLHVSAEQRAPSTSFVLLVGAAFAARISELAPFADGSRKQTVRVVAVGTLVAVSITLAFLLVGDVAVEDSGEEYEW